MIAILDSIYQLNNKGLSIKTKIRKEKHIIIISE